MSDASFQAALAQREQAPGLRQAAMLVHALAPEDRRWAIGQLPAEVRKQIETLIAELEAMGLPKDLHLIESALQSDKQLAPSEREANAPAGAMLAKDALVNDWVKRHGAAALARLLVREPTSLVSRLLALHDWPWRADLLRQLQPAVRREVAESLRLRDSSAPKPDPAADVLLDLLAKRLAAQPPQLQDASRAAEPSIAEGGGPRLPGRREGLVARWRSRWGRP